MATIVTLKGNQRVTLSFSAGLSESITLDLSSGSSTLQVNFPQTLSLSGPVEVS